MHLRVLISRIFFDSHILLSGRSTSSAIHWQDILQRRIKSILLIEFYWSILNKKFWNFLRHPLNIFKNCSINKYVNFYYCKNNMIQCGTKWPRDYAYNEQLGLNEVSREVINSDAEELRSSEEMIHNSSQATAPIIPGGLLKSRSGWKRWER